MLVSLERAWLACVSVDCKHARRGLCANERPFAAGRKPCAAKTAQSGIAHDLDQIIARALVGQTAFQQRISAGLLVSGKVDVGPPCVRVRLFFYPCKHRVDRSPEWLNGAHRA